MNDDNYFIKLSNDWVYIKDKKSLIEQYSNNHFAIYLLLLRNLTLRNTCIFNVNMIKDLLLNIGTKDSRQSKIIKDVLLSLHDNKIIKIYDDCNCEEEFSHFDKNNNKLYYAKVEDSPKDNFFMIYDNEIDKILKYCKSNDKNDVIKRGISAYNLIAYFGVIIKVINSKEKVGYFTYEVLYNKFGFASDTVSRFNDILFELKIIRFNNSFYNIQSNKSLSNIYARYEDEEQFNKAIEDRKNSINNSILLKDKKGIQDLKRSIKKKLTFRWEKYNYSIFADEELNELEQLEKDYYNLICKEKTDKQLKKVGFRIIDLDRFKSKSNIF